MASRDRKARRLKLKYGAKDLRTLRDPTLIPRDQRTPGDAFIGCTGEQLKWAWTVGQILAARDLAMLPPEKPDGEPK